MNRIALLASIAVVGCLFTAMDRPPIETVLEGQVHCGTAAHPAVCIGDSTTTVKVQGEFAATASNNDGGLTSMHLESGVAICSSGRAAITFAHQFSAVPQCTCSSEADAGCGLEGPATTTTLVLHGGTSSVVEWICAGKR